MLFLLLLLCESFQLCCEKAGKLIADDFGWDNNHHWMFASHNNNTSKDAKTHTTSQRASKWQNWLPVNTRRVCRLEILQLILCSYSCCCCWLCRCDNGAATAFNQRKLFVLYYLDSSLKYKLRECKKLNTREEIDSFPGFFFGSGEKFGVTTTRWLAGLTRAVRVTANAIISRILGSWAAGSFALPVYSTS